MIAKRMSVAIFKLKTAVVYLLVLTLIACIAAAPKSSIAAVTDSLGLCARTIVPSLFPFFVCCNILVHTGFVSVIGRWLNPIMRPLFNVSGAGAFAFVMGVISGYPVGARMVVQLRGEGLITQTEARRLLPFCNNSGPLFILGAVGITLLHSQPLGLMLYGVHIASALMVGVLFSFYRRGERGGQTVLPNHTAQACSLGEVFTESIRDSVTSVLTICGFIVFFAAILACMQGMLKNALIYLLPFTGWDKAFADGVLKGIFEITNGISGVAASGAGLRARLTAIAFLLGFGGISVHAQVLGIVARSDVGISTYLAGKTAQGLISAALAWMLGAWLPAVPTAQYYRQNLSGETMGMVGVGAFAFAAFLAALAVVYFVLNRQGRRARHKKL